MKMMYHVTVFGLVLICCHFFFFNDTATTEIYTLSLHDALPVLFAYRSSPIESIGVSPAFLEYGRTMRNPMAQLPGEIIWQRVKHLIDEFTLDQQQIRKRLLHKQNQIKQCYEIQQSYQFN